MRPPWSPHVLYLKLTVRSGLASAFISLQEGKAPGFGRVLAAVEQLSTVDWKRARYGSRMCSKGPPAHNRRELITRTTATQMKWIVGIILKASEELACACPVHMPHCTCPTTRLHVRPSHARPSACPWHVLMARGVLPGLCLRRAGLHTMPSGPLGAACDDHVR